MKLWTVFRCVDAVLKHGLVAVTNVPVMNPLMSCALRNARIQETHVLLGVRLAKTKSPLSFACLVDLSSRAEIQGSVSPLSGSVLSLPYHISTDYNKYKHSCWFIHSSALTISTTIDIHTLPDEPSLWLMAVIINLRSLLLFYVNPIQLGHGEKITTPYCTWRCIRNIQIDNLLLKQFIN